MEGSAPTETPSETPAVPTTVPATIPQPIPPPPPPGKGKKVMVILFILTLVALGSATGYFVGVKMTPAPKSSPTTQTDTQTKSNEATSSAITYGPYYPIPTPSPCLPGFSFYENTFFALCYPQSMSFQENAINNDKQVGIQVVFSDDVETLDIESNFIGNFDKNNCVSNKLIKVSGYDATENIIKEQSQTGTCGKNILQYATLISMGQGDSVYLISLSKKSGTYESDSLKYNFILQSFQVKK